MTRARRWFYLLYPPVCFYVFTYPVLRLSDWYNPQTGLGLSHGFVIWFVSVVALWYSFSGPKMVVRYLVVHWMGASFIFSTLTLAAEVVRLLIPVTDQSLVSGVLIVGVGLIVGAVVFSHHLSVKKQQIPSAKVTRPYRIVQISDVHIGSRRGGFMRRIVGKLNQLAPDFVVITGDLIDSSAVEYDALSSLKELKAPTYFCIGNHERYADLPKILDIVKRLGIKTLRQEAALEGELSFIGIDDSDRRDQIEKMLPTIERTENGYQILLYHRPVGWPTAVRHGIDLMLSGHTHNGQIFPFNLLVKQQFKRIRGLFVEGESRLYVSPGTGTWGPLMRLGSMNEISVFDIHPK